MQRPETNIVQTAGASIAKHPRFTAGRADPQIETATIGEHAWLRRFPNG